MFLPGKGWTSCHFYRLVSSYAYRCLPITRHVGSFNYVVVAAATADDGVVGGAGTSRPYLPYIPFVAPTPPPSTKHTLYHNLLRNVDELLSQLIRICCRRCRSRCNRDCLALFP